MGHTDRLGNRAYNERLSMRRAVTVRDELQRLGPVGVGGGVGAYGAGLGGEDPGTRVLHIRQRL